MTWQPLEKCPENTRVLFGWSDGKRWVGSTSAGVTRRYFYGKGAFDLDIDDNPPPRWCEIPAWEDK